MKLAEFLSDYPEARLATPEDNDKILELYRRLAMKGEGFNITFVKDPDYFRYLQYEAPEHWVLLIENEDGMAEGMATLAMRPCYVDGERDWVGHFSDLRFMRRRDRKTSFDWKSFMADICARGHEIEEWHGCRRWLGSFVMANDFARKAFTAMDTPFDISPVASYQMVNLLLRRPFGNGKLRGLTRKYPVRIERATASSLEELKSFLDSQNRRRELGFVFEGPDGELERRFESWDEFCLEDFYLARDGSGALVGCLAPWDLSAGRRIVVDNFPASLAVVAKMARGLNMNVPTPGDELKILYLTTQEISHDLDPDQRRAVFAALVGALYEDDIVERYHMVAMTDYDIESLLDVVEPVYFTQKTPTLLYQMHEPGADAVIAESKLRVRAGHEMCLT